jgi:hypothetical protein
MNTPYNTGKVQIGKYYQKPLYVEQDEDMIAVQGWLLGDRRAVKLNFYTNLSYCCLLAVLLILGVIYS